MAVANQLNYDRKVCINKLYLPSFNFLTQIMSLSKIAKIHHKLGRKLIESWKTPTQGYISLFYDEFRATPQVPPLSTPETTNKTVNLLKLKFFYYEN